jgi:hypothetical protein
MAIKRHFSIMSPQFLRRCPRVPCIKGKFLFSTEIPKELCDSMLMLEVSCDRNIRNKVAEVKAKNAYEVICFSSKKLYRHYLKKIWREQEPRMVMRYVLVK